MTERPKSQRLSIKPVFSEQRTAFRIKVAVCHIYTSIINTDKSKLYFKFVFSLKNVGIDVSRFPSVVDRCDIRLKIHKYQGGEKSV